MSDQPTNEPGEGRRLAEGAGDDPPDPSAGADGTDAHTAGNGSRAIDAGSKGLPDAVAHGAAPTRAPAVEPDEVTSPRRRRKRRPLPWIVVVLAAAAIAVVVRLFFVQTFYVPSISMTPTLQVGDRMLVLKVGYTIERGAILVFRHPPGDTSCGPGNDDLVKRVIGLPGETISSVGNTVYINGKPLAEPWLPKYDPLGAGGTIPKQKIPPNHYFMMGDNRAESCDSRRWGTLPRSLVVGRVFLIIWRHGHPAFDVI